MPRAVTFRCHRRSGGDVHADDHGSIRHEVTGDHDRQAVGHRMSIPAGAIADLMTA
jgi:hypothetical protein